MTSNYRAKFRRELKTFIRNETRAPRRDRIRSSAFANPLRGWWDATGDIAEERSPSLDLDNHPCPDFSQTGDLYDIGDSVSEALAIIDRWDTVVQRHKDQNDLPLFDADLMILQESAASVWSVAHRKSVLKTMARLTYGDYTADDLREDIERRSDTQLDFIDEYGTWYFGLPPAFRTDNGVDWREMIHRTRVER
jgi:hypothetical protein